MPSEENENETWRKRLRECNRRIDAHSADRVTTPQIPKTSSSTGGGGGGAFSAAQTAPVHATGKRKKHLAGESSDDDSGFDDYYG